MPILDNQRHELFAQGLARGLSASAAYIEAGYKANDGNAATLKGNQKVLERVEELRARASAKLEVSLQWLMEKAEEARALAMTTKQIGPAVAAIRELGVLSGHRVEKRENRNLNASDLSDGDLADIATGSGEGAFTPPRGSALTH